MNQIKTIYVNKPIDCGDDQPLEHSCVRFDCSIQDLTDARMLSAPNSLTRSMLVEKESKYLAQNALGLNFMVIYVNNCKCSHLGPTHEKYKSTFLQVCNDHKIPCLLVNESLSQELLENILNPTIDTETVGDVNFPTAFDFGIAWSSAQNEDHVYYQGFLLDGISLSTLEQAYYPPNEQQLIQPKASLDNIHSLLRCCNSFASYNAEFDCKALKLSKAVSDIAYEDIWLTAVKYIIFNPGLYRTAERKLARTKYGNMKSRSVDLLPFILEKPVAIEHRAAKDARDEHELRKFIKSNWIDPVHIESQWKPWQLLNDFPLFLKRAYGGSYEDASDVLTKCLPRFIKNPIKVY